MHCLLTHSCLLLLLLLPLMQALPDAQQVVLNVGGHTFTTTIATLRGAPAPSLFSAMFSGR
jgi:hypothetical protein